MNHHRGRVRVDGMGEDLPCLFKPSLFKGSEGVMGPAQSTRQNDSSLGFPFH